MSLASREAIALSAILAFALALRLDGIAFGFPALYDPDEPIFVLLALRLLRDHTLNPAWFGHPGTTTIYALALIELGVYAAGTLGGWFSGPRGFASAFYANPAIVFLPGRIFILLCGMAVVGLTWLLGRRLAGPRVGLLAAMLLAADPLHIRYSQIIRTDMQASIFILLVILAAVGICRTGRLRDYALAGLWLGFGCATKWPSAAAAAAVFGAAAWRTFHDPGERHTVLRRLAAFGASAVAALVVASPFLLLDLQTVRANLHAEERPVHLGATGHGFASNLLWYFDTPFRTALGAAGVLLAVLGAWVGARRVPAFAVALLPAAAAFLVMICAQKLIWERWTVPLLPLASIAAAAAIEGAARAAYARLGKRGETAAVAGLIAVILVPTLLTAHAQAAERRDDTRHHASAWAAAHIPPGSTVAVEHLAFDLLGRPWRFLYPAGEAGCVDVRMNLSGHIRYSTIDGWRGGRTVIDLGSITPALEVSCRADWAILVNYDRYLAEPTLFPQELAGYRRLLARGRIVATFRPVAGRTGGPVVRIVRFGGG